jgi:hypothetical protein
VFQTVLLLQKAPPVTLVAHVHMACARVTTPTIMPSHVTCVQVAMVGSGAWACAAMHIVAQNCAERDPADEFVDDVRMWVFEEQYEVSSGPDLRPASPSGCVAGAQGADVHTCILPGIQRHVLRVLRRMDGMCVPGCKKAMYITFNTKPRACLSFCQAVVS